MAVIALAGSATAPLCAAPRSTGPRLVLEGGAPLWASYSPPVMASAAPYDAPGALGALLAAALPGSSAAISAERAAGASVRAFAVLGEIPEQTTVALQDMVDACAAAADAAIQERAAACLAAHATGIQLLEASFSRAADGSDDTTKAVADAEVARRAAGADAGMRVGGTGAAASAAYAAAGGGGGGAVLAMYAGERDMAGAPHGLGIRYTYSAATHSLRIEDVGAWLHGVFCRRA